MGTGQRKAFFIALLNLSLGAPGDPGRPFYGMNAEEFYHSRSWKKMRAAVLRRDGYRCQRCKRYGRLRQATTVHHIKHLDEYPELAMEPDNLVSVCAACHNELHPEKAVEKNKRDPAGSRFF
jgi:5-methylcytosine-specific restriction endonuclease McrA